MKPLAYLAGYLYKAAADPLVKDRILRGLQSNRVSVRQGQAAVDQGIISQEEFNQYANPALLRLQNKNTAYPNPKVDSQIADATKNIEAQKSPDFAIRKQFVDKLMANSKFRAMSPETQRKVMLQGFERLKASTTGSEVATQPVVARASPASISAQTSAQASAQVPEVQSKVNLPGFEGSTLASPRQQNSQAPSIPPQIAPSPEEPFFTPEKLREAYPPAPPLRVPDYQVGPRGSTSNVGAFMANRGAPAVTKAPNPVETQKLRTLGMLRQTAANPVSTVKPPDEAFAKDWDSTPKPDTAFTNDWLNRKIPFKDWSNIGQALGYLPGAGGATPSYIEPSTNFRSFPFLPRSRIVRPTPTSAAERYQPTTKGAMSRVGTFIAGQPPIYQSPITPMQKRLLGQKFENMRGMAKSTPAFQAKAPSSASATKPTRLGKNQNTDVTSFGY